jgi:hypothetical protein
MLNLGALGHPAEGPLLALFAAKAKFPKGHLPQIFTFGKIPIK